MARRGNLDCKSKTERDPFGSALGRLFDCQPQNRRLLAQDNMSFGVVEKVEMTGRVDETD